MFLDYLGHGLSVGELSLPLKYLKFLSQSSKQTKKQNRLKFQKIDPKQKRKMKTKNCGTLIGYFLIGAVIGGFGSYLIMSQLYPSELTAGPGLKLMINVKTYDVINDDVITNDVIEF